MGRGKTLEAYAALVERWVAQPGSPAPERVPSVLPKLRKLLGRRTPESASPLLDHWLGLLSRVPPLATLGNATILLCEPRLAARDGHVVVARGLSDVWWAIRDRDLVDLDPVVWIRGLGESPPWQRVDRLSQFLIGLLAFQVCWRDAGEAALLAKHVGSIWGIDPEVDVGSREVVPAIREHYELVGRFSTGDSGGYRQRYAIFETYTDAETLIMLGVFRGHPRFGNQTRANVKVATLSDEALGSFVRRARPSGWSGLLSRGPRGGWKTCSGRDEWRWTV